MKIATKCDTYRPTKAEERLLVALADPENRLLNVMDLCKKIGVSRETYYRTFKKPEFVELATSLGMQVIRNQSLPLVHAGIKKALEGSFPHWKVLLEMSGLICDVTPDPEEQITIRFAANTL